MHSIPCNCPWSASCVFFPACERVQLASSYPSIALKRASHILMVLCSLSDHDSSICHSMSFKRQWILNAYAIAKLMGKLNSNPSKLSRRLLLLWIMTSSLWGAWATSMPLLYAAATNLCWSMTQFVPQKWYVPAVCSCSLMCLISCLTSSATSFRHSWP